MKWLASLFLLSLTQIAFAQTRVEIPLFINNNSELIPMETINKHLGFNEKNKFLEKLNVTNTPVSIKMAFDEYWNLFTKTQDLELNLASDIPGVNQKDKLRTCYDGNPAEAVNIISSLADSVFSDQLGIWGWRYKNEIHLINARSHRLLVSKSKDWKTFSSKGETILILSHQSDDADDFNAGYIVKCSDI